MELWFPDCLGSYFCSFQLECLNEFFDKVLLDLSIISTNKGKVLMDCSIRGLPLCYASLAWKKESSLHVLYLNEFLTIT